MSQVIEVTNHNVQMIKRMVSKCTGDMSTLTAESLVNNDTTEEYARKSKELGEKLDKFVDFTISKLSK